MISLGAGLVYYLEYVSWADFDAFEASCAFVMVDGWWVPFYDGVFWADVGAVVAGSAGSNRGYVNGLVVLEFPCFI